MLANIIGKLREEAEKTSMTNAALLAHWKGEEKTAYIESGQASKDRIKALGLGSGMAGVMGIMLVAASNQAAALGTSAMLASVSTALAGLGTVAVGGTVLPAATVITLGVAAAGLAVTAVNELRSVDWGKGIETARALSDRYERNAALDPNGPSKEVGLKNWVMGVKNMLVDGIKTAVARIREGNDTQNITTPEQSSLAAAKDFMRSSKLVEEAVNTNQGQYTGQVLFESAGHVVQDRGRSSAAIHEKARLAVHGIEGFKVGKSLRVKYQQGRGNVLNSQDKSKDKGQTR
ncbi:MAG TPA: hypothetical protein VF450_00190 [Noviherbaspirillum sp.]